MAEIEGGHPPAADPAAEEVAAAGPTVDDIAGPAAEWTGVKRAADIATP